MELYLSHGRVTPDEQLDDWGKEGPRLQGVKGIHQTYGDYINVHFKDRASAQAARALTGWHEWDDNALVMRWHQDMVHTECNGVSMYYGDWGII